MITETLVRLFVRNWSKPEKGEVRLAYGLLAGCTGIAVNVFLCIFKLVIGIISGSIAVSADAVNNLWDAGSGLVTVFGFKLAARPADQGHPFGHGRTEYIGGLIVAVIVLAMGVNFFKESVMRLFSDTQVHISMAMLILLGCSVLLKVWLFFFYRKISSVIQSTTVKAAAFDSLSDCICTVAVIISVIAGHYTALPVDAVTGIAVALLILYGGVGIFKEAVNPLLGERPDQKLVASLYQKLLECKGIYGVHDIMIHNYGPNQYYGTAHVEIAKHGSPMEVHNILESAEVAVAKELPVQLTLHGDPFLVEDPVAQEWRVKLEQTIHDFDPKFRVYDYLYQETEGKRKLCFHLMIPRSYSISREQISSEILAEMKKLDPQISLDITFIHSFV